MKIFLWKHCTLQHFIFSYYKLSACNGHTIRLSADAIV